MFTTRSSTLLILATLALVVGLLRPNERVALMGLAIMMWLALQWIGILWAMRSVNGIVSECRRTIDNQNRQQITLAVDQPVLATVTGKLAASLRGFRISIHDMMPGACEIEEGFNEFSLDKLSEREFTLKYRFKPVACGHIRLPGVVVSITDPNGLFRGQRFVPLPQKITALPFLIRPQTTVSVLKHNNLQRILGHHRHRSPGISAELLGIRDYQPGDPPRTIAWKPTARMGKLMSREFESEVPIRSTILADMSSYQFAGRPGPAVADRVITAVASVARLLLSDRDPVSLVMVTENGGTRIPHGHGERQLSRLLHHLLIAADPNPRVESLPTRTLVDVVFNDSFRRFPELYDRRVSFMPIGRTLFHPIRSRFHRRRCRMAPVLAALLGKPYGSEYRMVTSASEMRRACFAYARKYSISDAPARANVDNELAELRVEANQQLCHRFADARSRAKDNELFLIAGCLPQSGEEAERLLDVLRVCLAVGNRVVFIDAGNVVPIESIEDPVAKRALYQANLNQDVSSSLWMRQKLASLGVLYSRIDDPKLMKKVAIEVELIRSGKSRSAGARHLRGVVR